MKYRLIMIIIILSLNLTAISAYSFAETQFGTYTPAQFRDYWYNHGAEISRFSLQQMRYGEIHNGDAVLVFVTEEMNPAIQIKAEKSLEGNPLVRYEINYPDEQRTLRVFFEKDFPYRIQQWEESYRGLSGDIKKTLTTRATRTHSIMDAYWRHHGNKDRILLKKLGLNATEMGSK